MSTAKSTPSVSYAKYSLFNRLWVDVLGTLSDHPNCHCHHDPDQLHGPYRSWTRKVAGKTVTRRLNDDQLNRYRPWFDNARRLRQLVTELETLSAQTAENNEGWPRK